jgi:hypothetical protein
LETEDSERFSVYGFSIDYPRICWIEFNPKSRRDAGDVVFHFLEKEKIFLSWGELERAEKRFQSIEGHAEHGISVLRKNRAARDFERVRNDSLTLNSHSAVYNRIRVKELLAGFLSGKKTVEREAYSIHLHCRESSRYFVLYSLLSRSATDETYEKSILAMANSFKCH